MRQDSDHLVKAGFTLTELLVAIAIIGILATLTVVASIAAKRRVSSTQCLRNLGQQGVALGGFVQDNSCYPLSVNPPMNRSLYPEHGTIWYTAILPGAFTPMGTGILRCPSARAPKGFEFDYTHYGYNHGGIVGSATDPALGIGGDGQGPGSGTPVKEGQVLTPSKMIAVADAAESWNGVVRDGFAYIGRTFNVGGILGGNDRMRERHFGDLNVLFCDGHVDSIPFETLFIDESDASLSLWNRDGDAHRERLH